MSLVGLSGCVGVEQVLLLPEAMWKLMVTAGLLPFLFWTTAICALKLVAWAQITIELLPANCIAGRLYDPSEPDVAGVGGVLQPDEHEIVAPWSGDPDPDPT